MPGSFFDTNILLYLASGNRAKAERAEEIVGEGGVISVQVLNEITNVARRKMQLSWVEIRQFLSTIRSLLPVHPVTLEIHEAGLALAERYGLSTYDAMIVTSAIDAGCDTLWSEDMQHDMVIARRLRIRDPFRGTT
jgi:predicted nucleic acid-binding protein